MNILCTGCGGLIGSSVSERLFNSNGLHYVCGVDNFSFGNKSVVPKGMDFYETDFNDLLTPFLNQFDVLVHCAVTNIIAAQGNEINTFKNNALNTIKLFQRFRGKIVFTSTASVYNQAKEFPTPETAIIHTYNSYDSSKLIAELFLQERQNYTTLRLSNVFGEGQLPSNPYAGVAIKMLWNALNDIPIEIVGDGKQTRDMTYIDDTVDAIMCAIEQPAKNTEINISGNNEIEMNDLARMILQLSENEHRKWVNIPKRSIDTIDRRCLNIEKAKNILGWQPRVSLKDGLKLTLDWMKNEMVE